jgi:arylsulfatase A-like enzyme
MPTFTNLLGLQPPADVEGMNLSHAVLGKSGPEPEAALMQICGATADWTPGHEWRALRDKQYTYAIYRVDRKELLFDNHADPLQMKNLAEDPAHAAKIDKFRKLLKKRMDAIKDTFEPSSYYKDNWTDGNRDIIKSATNNFAPIV